MPKISKPKNNFWRMSLWVFVGIFALGQLQRVEISPTVAFYVHDIFIISWLLILFIIRRDFLIYLSRIMSQILRQKWSRILIVAFCWSLITTLYFCLTQMTLVPILYLARLDVYLVFAISIRYLAKQSDNKILTAQHLCAVILIAILGLLQYLFLPDTRFLFIFGWDDHYYRLISTLLDPGFTGLILLMGFLFSLRISYPSTKIAQALLPIMRSTILLAIMLTYSRATYLSAVVAGFYYFWQVGLYKAANVKKIVVLGLAVIMLGSILQLTKGGEGTNLLRTSTIVARLENTSHHISKMSPKTLLLGNGWFTAQNLPSNLPNHSKTPDNIFVFLINSMGLPVLIIVLISLFKHYYTRIKTQPMLMTVLIAVLCHSQFSNSFFQPFVWLYFWWGTLSLNFQNKTIKT
jgi:hypothetical protein